MECKICGKPSGFFPLCKECNSLKEQGKIVKCEKCNEWHYVNKPCKCKVDTKKVAEFDGDCIVCGSKAPNGNLCRECYYEMKDYYSNSFDKNAKVFELKDYYFNLKQNIYRMKNFDYIKNNCNKLFALATLVKDVHSDESLTDRIVKDITEIVSIKKPKEEQVVTEQSKTKDSRKEEILRTLDGHYVKSNPETVIDDILYELRIVHCYEKKVPIDIDQQSVTCDWFIPVLDNRRGIYIEYWGMNTKEYLANKERKRKAYKENNIPLIEIEKDDYLDKQGLSDRLLQQINKIAKETFGVVGFIKMF